MTTVTVKKLTEPDALHCQYPGQNRLQDAYIQLDLETGIMSADYNGEIGGGIPFSVFHGRTRRWTIPVLTADAANSVMEDWVPTAQRILDGAEIEWNGHNHVAVLTDDAREADEILGRAMDAGELDDLPNVETLNADDWYSGVSRSEVISQAGITGETTDDELAAIVTAEEEEAASCGEGGNVSIPDGFDEYLRALRDDLRDEFTAALLFDLDGIAYEIEDLDAKREQLAARRDGIVRRLAVAQVSGTDISHAAHVSPARVGQIIGAAKTFAAETRARIAAGVRWEPAVHYELAGEFLHLVENTPDPRTVFVPIAGGEVVLLHAGDAFLQTTGVFVDEPSVEPAS
jgi:hypothetical protein